jgi:uncharacterized C2H2 Zn-finger protein
MSAQIIQHICATCNHIFSTNFKLERHQNAKRKCHSTLSCVRCNKIFKRKQDFDKHQARKFTCQEIVIDALTQATTQ